MASLLLNLKMSSRIQDLTGLGKTMRRLDVRGMIRPFKFLITSNAFKEVSPGETLEILWGDPDSLADLFRILPPSSYDPVITKTMEGTEPCVRIRLKKTT